MRRIRASVGATLVELLVALTFAGIIGAQALSWMRSATRAVQLLEDTTGRNRGLWLALDAIATDVRNAGHAPSGAALTGLGEATTRSLTLLRDSNGDGDSDDAGERIRYRFDLAAGELRRATATGGLQVFVDELSDTDLQFAFRDIDGAAIASRGGGLGAADRASTARVDVVVRRQTGTEVVTISVGLRNRG